MAGGSSSIFDHKYALGYVTFTCLGAVLYGYDGVYFSGVQAMSRSPIYTDVYPTHKSRGTRLTRGKTAAPFVRSFGTQNPDGTYSIKAGPLAVMTSMINVGELVGSIGAALVNDYAGRKATWLASSLLVCLGCILQIVTDSGNVGYINGGRVILGVGVGGFAATGPIYIGVSEDARLLTVGSNIIAPMLILVPPQYRKSLQHNTGVLCSSCGRWLCPSRRFWQLASTAAWRSTPTHLDGGSRLPSRCSSHFLS